MDMAALLEPRSPALEMAHFDAILGP